MTTSSPGSPYFASAPSGFTTRAVRPGIRTPAQPGVGGITSLGESATVVKVSVSPGRRESAARDKRRAVQRTVSLESIALR